MVTNRGCCCFSQSTGRRSTLRGEGWEALDRAISQSGENRGQIARTEIFNRRQLSTTERIAATFGPACGLPMCIQILPPQTLEELVLGGQYLLLACTSPSPIV